MLVGDLIRKSSSYAIVTLLCAARNGTEESFIIPFSLSEVSEVQHFVGREQEISDLCETLSSSRDSRRVAVLHGLGGIGKTQLTIEYVKRHCAEYSAIFWINSKDEDSIQQSLVKAALRIIQEHPSASRLAAVDMTGKLDEIADAVLQWLSLPKNMQWLMVYDNYDNPKLPGQTNTTAVDIEQFFPKTYHGTIIIMTRSSQVDIGRQIQVKKMKEVQDSLKILSHTSRREGVLSGKFIAHMWLILTKCCDRS